MVEEQALKSICRSPTLIRPSTAPFNPVRYLAFYLSEMAKKNAVVRQREKEEREVEELKVLEAEEKVREK